MKLKMIYLVLILILFNTLACKNEMERHHTAGRQFAPKFESGSATKGSTTIPTFPSGYPPLGFPPIGFPPIFPGVIFTADGFPGSKIVTKGSNVVISWALPLSTYFNDCVLLGTSVTGKTGQFIINNIQEDRQLILECISALGKQQYVYNVYVQQTPTATHPTVSVTANQQNNSYNATAGEEVNLAWVSTNATKCKLNNPVSDALNGSLKVKPLMTTVYIVTCENAAGQSAIDSVVINVQSSQSKLPSINFTLPTGITQPIVLNKGASINIGWSATDATNCHTLPVGQTGTSGSIVLNNLQNSTVVSVTCHNSFGSTQNSLPLAILSQQSDIQAILKVNGSTQKQTVSAGENINLDWKCEGNVASGVVYAGTHQLSGAQGVVDIAAPNFSTHVILVCKDVNNAEKIASVQIEIKNQNEIVTNYFINGKKSNVQVEYGSSITIVWNAPNAVCVLDPNKLTSSSASLQIDNIQKSTTYQLKCTSSIGSVTESIDVNVVNVPPVGEGTNPHIKSLRLVGPASITKGVCSGPYQVRSFDASNNMSAVTSRIGLSLFVEDDVDVKIYDSQNCVVGRKNVHIEIGKNSSTPLFYIKSFMVGSEPILNAQVMPRPIELTKLKVKVLEANVSALTVISTKNTAKLNECVRVNLYPVTVLGDIRNTTQNIIADVVATGSAKSYSNENCSTLNSVVTIPVNANKSHFYVKNSNAQTNQIVAIDRAQNLAGSNKINIQFLASGNTPLNPTYEVYKLIESINQKYTPYFFGGRILYMERIHTISSASSCVLGQTYGFSGNYAWATKGCRATFKIGFEQ